MTTKEWLNRARTIDGELAALVEAREVMIAKLTKATQTLTGDTVQSSKDNHKFDELGELAFQIEQAVKTCKAVKAEVMGAIRQVKSGTCRELLVRRYIDGETWEKIAVTMNYSWRQVHRLHGRALIEVTEVLKNGRY